MNRRGFFVALLAMLVPSAAWAFRPFGKFGRNKKNGGK